MYERELKKPTIIDAEKTKPNVPRGVQNATFQITIILKHLKLQKIYGDTYIKSTILTRPVTPLYP